MTGFGRMDEKRGRAGGGKCRSDLVSDVAGLAHAGDDHAPLRGANEVDRGDE